MLMSACALLDRTPKPNADQVRKDLSGNLCRCTGYSQIVEAVLDAAGVAHGN
jgi:carbon-monoxide dehydrogenase small subunit